MYKQARCRSAVVALFKHTTHAAGTHHSSRVPKGGPAENIIAQLSGRTDGCLNEEDAQSPQPQIAVPGTTSEQKLSNGGIDTVYTNGNGHLAQFTGELRLEPASGARMVVWAHDGLQHIRKYIYRSH